MNPGKRAGRRWAWAAACLAAATGCGQHPRLSPASYDLARALYTVCNLQAADQLPRFEEQLAQQAAAGRVGDDERAALAKILAMARDGDWQGAQERTRTLIAAQNSQ